ncbi:hypothetical protein [Nocardia goodfellowii]|uniref:SMODS and SLOG-associating 2TM effector domain-containing protein n=1 Tax=Nocardia goodfellowii TaxID=882446 RepID=A0ABS4QI61_9NOCA|nr:hypothetical protein [Nocardia goodfellowii]MBP2191389.1 hypothetical protein [Nocardia goodfellowii]
MGGWMKKYAKHFGAFLVAAMIAAATLLIGPNYGWWQAGVAVLTVGTVATAAPIVFSFLNFGELNDPGEWFSSASQLGTEQSRVLEHYSRIHGTLRFWKNRAAAYHRLHLARVFWSLLSAVLLPVLIQRFEHADGWSVLFMTAFTTWTGLVVGIAYTFKAEEKYQGLRQQESDFYDVCRRLLDTTSATDQNLKQKVDDYIEVVSLIRRTARRVETGSPPSAL